MSNEYEEFMKSSQQDKKEIEEIVQTVSDRVSWRRAWSLFYKLLIMQTIMGIIFWLLFIGIFSSILNQPNEIPQTNYSKYDECFAKALENNKDISTCDKYYIGN